MTMGGLELIAWAALKMLAYMLQGAVLFGIILGAYAVGKRVLRWARGTTMR